MKESWVQLAGVAVGGAAGAMARFAVTRLARAYLPPTLPYGTLIVNTAGSLVLGVLIGLAGSSVKLPPLLTITVGVGFCGAFTTFSTFATETLTSDRVLIAIANLVANNALALAAAAIGLYAGHYLGQMLGH